MPYLSLQTNKILSDDEQSNLLRSSSKLVADLLGKPEKYVMVTIEPTKPMLFSGSDAPAAYIELKSINLPEDKTTELSEHLCNLLNKVSSIEKDRIYIEFVAAPRKMWGWNSATF